MSSACLPSRQFSTIFGVIKFSPIFSILIFFIAVWLLQRCSSQHLRATKNEFFYFLISNVLSTFILASGTAPVLHFPFIGYQTYGFLHILNSSNEAWPLIFSVFLYSILILAFSQLIQVRCEIIQNYCDESPIIFYLIQYFLKSIYACLLLSNWSILLLLDFKQYQDDLKSKHIKLSNGALCPLFLFFGSISWRIIAILISNIALLIVFLIFSISQIFSTFLLFREAKHKMSRKTWSIQNGFLLSLTIYLFIFIIFIFIFSIILLFFTSSEKTAYLLIFFISHHGTISMLFFIFSHRLVRQFFIEKLNLCLPESHQIDRKIETSEIYDIGRGAQVFTVVQSIPNA